VGARGYKRTITIGFNAKEVLDGTKNVNMAMRELDNEFAKAAREAKKTGSEIEKLGVQKEYLTEKISLQEQKVQELSDAYEIIARDTGEYSKATIDAKRDVINAQKALDGMKESLRNTTKELKEKETALGRAVTKIENFKKAAQDAGVDIDKLGNNMMIAGGAMAGLGVIAGKMAMDFDEAIAKSMTRVRDFSITHEELSDMVLNTASTYNIAAGDMANAAFKLLDANTDVADIMPALENAARLSRAGFVDLNTATGILTQTTNLFGLSIEEQTEAIDMLVLAARESNFSIADLEGSFRRVGPAIRATGMTLEEYLAIAMQVSDTAIDQRDAIRSLEGVINSIASPSNTATQAAADLGFVWDANANSTRTLSENLTLLQSMLGESSAVYQDLFASATAYQAAQELIASGIPPLAEEFEGFANFTLAALEEAYEELSPAIKRAGLSQEEFFAIAGVVSGEARSQQDAINSLGVLLNSVTHPTTNAAWAAEQLGIAWSEGTNASRSFEENLGIMNTLMGQSSIAHQDLFKDINAYRMVQELTADGMTTLTENLNSLNTATGEANEVIEILDSTAGAKLRASLNDLQINLIRAGEAFQPIVRVVANLVGIVADLPPGFFTTTAAVGAVVLALGGLVKAINALKAVQQAINTVKAISNALFGRSKKAALEDAAASGTVTQAKGAETTATIANSNAKKTDIALSKKQKMANKGVAVSNTTLAKTQAKVGKAFWASKKPMLIIAAIAIALAVVFAILFNQLGNIQQMLQSVQNTMNADIAAAQQAIPMDANARGTAYARGGRSLVGEEGPEIVDLPRGSKVYPAGRTRQMMQGGDVPPVYVENVTLQVDVSEIDEVYKLLDVFQDFRHKVVVYGGV